MRRKTNQLAKGFRDLWFIARYMLQFWPWLAISAAFGLMSAMLAPATVFALTAVLDTFLGLISPDFSSLKEISNSSGGMFSLGQPANRLLTALNGIVSDSPRAVLVALVLLFALVALAYQLTLFAVRWLSYLVSRRTYYLLQRELFRNVLHQSITFFHQQKAGDLISRISNDVNVTTDQLSELVQSVVQRLITLMILVFLMVQTSVLVTLIIVSIGALTASLPTLLGRKFRHFHVQQQSGQATVMSSVHESLVGARLIKSSCNEERHLDAYWQHALRLFSVERRIRLFKLVVEHSSQISAVLGLSALLVIGGSLISSGAISAVEYAAFIYLAREVGVLVAGLGQNILGVHAAAGTSKRIVELLRLKPSIEDGHKPKRDFLNTIEVRNVSFQYGGETGVRDISLNIRRGDFVALVGPSGGGKSTLLDLLLRLHDPDSGQILIDGEDIKEFTLNTYRRLFGAVSQDAFLFNDTVYNNINYVANSPDENCVVESARIASADQFVGLLPAKYQTYLGDRGMRVSGGERQRLAIARALAAEPQILLFDEATSALDSKSERQVQQAIDGLVGTRTAIVVAHRLSTIARADRIYVLDRGRIVESGTHEELKSRNGLYASLLRLQSSAYGENKEGVGERVGAAASDSA